MTRRTGTALQWISSDGRWLATVRRLLPWLLLASILITIGGVRWRLHDVPLERDEGEYVLAGRVLLHGLPPYQVAHSSQKFPGTYLVSALSLAIFGDRPEALRLGLLAINLATVALLFLVARQLTNERGALAAATAYGLLSIGSGVLGFAAHSTHFVSFFVLAGLTALMAARGEQFRVAALIIAGFCFGMSVVMRQPSIFFVLFGCAALAVCAYRSGGMQFAVIAVTIFSAAAALPLLLMLTWLWFAGVFPTFWFWTVTYALSYGTQVSLADGLRNLAATLPGVLGDNSLLWLGALLGLSVLIYERNARAGFVAGWLAASTLAVATGLHFRNHYFIQFLPVVAVLFGVAAAGPYRSSWKIGEITAVVALAVALLLQFDYLFRAPPDQISRHVYRGNSFVESLEIAEQLRTRSMPGDTLAVLGSEAQLYVYSNLPPATRYIYTYALMEESPFARQMQDEMISEIEAARPRFIVFVQIPMSWLVRPRSELHIFEWAADYLTRYYTMIGAIEVEPGGIGRSLWNDDVSQWNPRSELRVLVFESRES